jgi:hypothetical protein
LPAGEKGDLLDGSTTYAGDEDEMKEGAALAAAEIPGATFVSLPGHTHVSAERVADQLLPPVLELFRAAAPPTPLSASKSREGLGTIPAVRIHPHCLTW